MYKNYIYEVKEFYRSAFHDNSSTTCYTEEEAMNLIKDRMSVLKLNFKSFIRKTCQHGLIACRIYYFNPDISGVCFLIEKKEVK